MSTYKQKKEMESDRKKVNPRRDGHLDNLARQGLYADAQATHPMDMRLQKSIAVNITECNPDMDIVGTGMYTTTICKLNDNAINVHDPLGMYVDSIQKDRVQILCDRYIRKQNEKPELIHSLKAHNFEEQLAHLLRRYKDGYKQGKLRTKLKNHWATPDSYMLAINEGCRTNTERFASPLNFNPVHENYFSLYPEDAVFGAYTDAYSVPWTGSSQVNMEYEADHMDKGIRWAIGTATRCQQPMLAVFVLPCWRLTAYSKWLVHPNVHEIATLPASSFRFKCPDHWRGMQETAGAPKWDVKIFMVANKNGVDAFYQPQHLYKALRQAATEHGANVALPIHTDLPPGWPNAELAANNTVSTPKRLKQLIKDDNQDLSQGGKNGLPQSC